MTKKKELFNDKNEGLVEKRSRGKKIDMGSLLSAEDRQKGLGLPKKGEEGLL